MNVTVGGVGGGVDECDGGGGVDERDCGGWS